MCMISRLMVVLVGSYLLGGIPFGVIVGRLWKGVDVRRYGSGNIGFTNVLRILGWKPAIVVLLADVGKGLAAVLLARWVLWIAGSCEAGSAPEPAWLSGYVVVAGLSTILGHSFSPFIGFRGGRGVATGLGVILGLSWQSALAVLLIWIIVVGATRFVSLGSVIAGMSLPVFMVICREPLAYQVFAAVACVLVIVRHIPNIKRLLAGTEAKFGERVATESGEEPKSSDE